MTSLPTDVGRASWRPGRTIRITTFALLGVSLHAGEVAAQVTEPIARASELLVKPGALHTWMRTYQPRIRQLDARNREADAEAKDARLLPNPTLGLAVGGITLGGRNPPGLSFAETQNYQVSLAQTFELGKRQHRIRAAELHAQSVALDAKYLEATMLADARENLARLVYLKERQHVLEERLVAARGIVRLDQTRLDRGDVSGIDHRRLMLDVVNVERELAQNASDAAAARAACTVALGTQCEPDVSLEALADISAVPGPSKLVRFEPAARPDIKARRAEEQAMREQALLHANRSIPDPQLGVSYLRDNLTVAGNQPNSFGVFVSVPLPIFDHGQHERTIALSRAEQSAAAAAGAELEASSGIVYLAQAERILLEKLAMLNDRALPLGVDVLDSTEKAYRLGQVSMTDLLLARRQRSELALDLADTRYALHQVRNQMRLFLGTDVSGGDFP